MVRRFGPGFWIAVVLFLLMLPQGVFAEEASPDGAVEDVTVVEESDDEQAAAVEEFDDEEVLYGPGGRPLRQDYPGTEESLRARMDTGAVGARERGELENPEEVFDLRVRELETQIDDLKERVFRSKSRIILLKETVLAENLAGSRAVINFENDLGAGYEVYRAVFSVDGGRVHSSVDSNELRARDGLEIFNAPVTPGAHTVSVSMNMRGSGYGIFSYARGYDFSLRFSCQFTAEEGRTTLVTVRTFRGGNVFTAHEDRPTGVCHVSMVELNVGDMPEREVPNRD